MWIFRKIRLECIQLETKFSEKQTIGQATATTSDWCPRASIVPASEHDDFSIIVRWQIFWSILIHLEHDQYQTLCSRTKVVNLIFDKNAKFCGRFGMKMGPINALWTPAILGDRWIVQPKQYFNLKLIDWLASIFEFVFYFTFSSSIFWMVVWQFQYANKLSRYSSLCQFQVAANRYIDVVMPNVTAWMWIWIILYVCVCVCFGVLMSMCVYLCLNQKHCTNTANESIKKEQTNKISLIEALPVQVSKNTLNRISSSLSFIQLLSFSVCFVLRKKRFDGLVCPLMFISTWALKSSSCISYAKWFVCHPNQMVLAGFFHHSIKTVWLK